MTKRLKTENESTNRLYEPESILDEKEKPKGGLLFLIKWKGYSLNECTWEPILSFYQCKWIIKEWIDKKIKDLEKKYKYVTEIKGKKNQRKSLFLVGQSDGKQDLWILRKDLILVKPEFFHQIPLNYDKRRREYEINQLKQHEKKKLYLKYTRRSILNSQWDEEDEELYSEEEEEEDDLFERNIISDQHTKTKDEIHSRQTRETKQTKSKEIRSSSNSSKSSSIDSVNNNRIDTFERNKPKNSKSKKGDFHFNSVAHSNQSKKDLSFCSIFNKKEESEDIECQKSIDYNKYPVHGTLGLDLPHSIRSMVIDKKIGSPTDKYFACDITWKIRGNMCQPLDSRVSREELRKQHPMILIQFYEKHLVFEESNEKRVEKKQPPSPKDIPCKLISDFEELSLNSSQVTEPIQI